MILLILMPKKGKTKLTADEVLVAIKASKVVPTAQSLCKDGGGPLPFSYSDVRGCLRQSPQLRGAQIKKGIQIVEDCTDDELFHMISEGVFIEDSDEFEEARNKKLDTIIRKAIINSKTVPTMANLSEDGGGPLKITYYYVSERFESSKSLVQLLESVGIYFMQYCAFETFVQYISSTENRNYPEKVIEARNKRLDEIIEVAIEISEDVPTGRSLCKQFGGLLSFGYGQVNKRINANPVLEVLQEYYGLLIVADLDDESILKLYRKKACVALERVYTEIVRKVDDIIKAYINSEKVMTVSNISKDSGGSLNLPLRTLHTRFDENSTLGSLLELKGIEVVRECDRKTFFDSIRGKIWRSVSESIKEVIDLKFRTYIENAIELFPAIPTYRGLAKDLGVSDFAVRKKINNDPHLRKIFLEKQNLTEDQINALQAENKKPTRGFSQSIERRLPNTRIFRESLALLRQLRTLFEGMSTLEISFYPQPLSRAACFLGIPINSVYQRAHSLKDPESELQGDQPFDTLAMLQICHRLTNEALLNAFNQANRNLTEGGHLLLSLPQEFIRTDESERQVQDIGFELQQDGLLFTQTLSIAELDALGIQDPDRLKRKVQQNTRVYVYTKTRPAQGERLDSYIREPRASGTGLFHPTLGEINTPDDILRDLSCIFQERRTSLLDAFMLTVLDDDTYRPIGGVGYDMNPQAPKTVEKWTHGQTLLSDGELQQISKNLTNPSFQKKALIKRGHETLIPKRMVERALRC